MENKGGEGVHRFTLHHDCRFSSYVALWCAGGQKWRNPAGQRMPGQGIANSAQLPSEARCWFPPPPRAQLPDTRTGRLGGGSAKRQQQRQTIQWEETPKEYAANRGMGVLSVCTLGHQRPSSSDTRHLWEGGCWGKAKEKKKQSVTERERQRKTGRERGGGREWEACWCHICTKPIPATMVTWHLSPDALVPLSLPWADTLKPNAYMLYKVSHSINVNCDMLKKIEFPLFVCVGGHFFVCSLKFDLISFYIFSGLELYRTVRSKEKYMNPKSGTNTSLTHGHTDKHRIKIRGQAQKKS